MESGLAHGKSWKINQMVAAFYTHVRACDHEDDGPMTSVNCLQYDYQRRGKSGRRQIWVERDHARRQPFMWMTALVVVVDDDMFSALMYIIIVYCQTYFSLLFSIIMNCVAYSMLCVTFCAFGNWFAKFIWKSDLFDSHLIEQSGKEKENGHEWSWKVLKNVHKKVLESHGKPLSLFCVHHVVVAQDRSDGVLDVGVELCVLIADWICRPTSWSCGSRRNALQPVLSRRTDWHGSVAVQRSCRVWGWYAATQSFHDNIDECGMTVTLSLLHF